MKRGDILTMTKDGTTEFYHVEQVNSDGTVDTIADSTGEPVGINTRVENPIPASMAEVLAYRAQIASVPVVLDDQGGDGETAS